MAKRKGTQAAPSSSDSPPPPPKRLSWNQERFVEEYVRHGNATLAYRNAYPESGPGSWDVCGPALLGKPGISKAIGLRQEADRELLKFSRIDALKILIGQAGATLDDFSALFDDPADKKNYRGLGYKRHALESGKKTVTTLPDGTVKEQIEVKIISPGERRAAINDLWEKLGLGEESSKTNWFDGFERLAELVRGTKKAE